MSRSRLLLCSGSFGVNFGGLKFVLQLDSIWSGLEPLGEGRYLMDTGSNRHFHTAFELRDW
jgi:hypothetical protein